MNNVHTWQTRISPHDLSVKLELAHDCVAIVAVLAGCMHCLYVFDDNVTLDYSCM